MLVQSRDDDCRTAEDVRRRAESVAERRRRFFSPASPQVVYLREPPEVHVVAPPLQEMFELVAASCELSPQQLANAIELFKNEPVEKLRYRMRLSDIQRSVAARANLHKENLLADDRRKHIVKARHIAFVLCRRLTWRSFPEIGRAFGGRDHSSIIFAARKLKALLEFVEENIRPGANLSEWVEMMFENYDRLVK